jgi:predicted lipid-binding transport protein (Tim44 family)
LAHLKENGMKKFLSLMVVVLLSVGVAVTDAEAKRLGGGTSIGKQRATPAMKEAQQAPPQAPSSAAASSAIPAKPAMTPPIAKPSFMQKWGGMLAGFGMGALLGSMFGGHLGGLGGLLNILLIGAAIYFVFKFIASRRAGASNNMQYAGASAPQSLPVPAQPAPMNFGGAAPQEAPPSARNIPPNFDVEPFVRQAKTSFIRMQAANDAKDLNDLRDFTTPEVYAELSMQIRERGDAPQKTDVVTLNADLLEVANEGDYAIASVRYTGLIREAEGAPTNFDEVWHVQKNLKDPKGTWLVAGIQQLS